MCYIAKNTMIVEGLKSYPAEPSLVFMTFMGVKMNDQFSVSVIHDFSKGIIHLVHTQNFPKN